MRRRVLAVLCAVLCIAGRTALTSALTVAAASSGALVVQAHPTLLSYQSQGLESGSWDEGAHLTIAGNASPALYPGTSSSIDLSFTNETDEAIELPADAVKITVSSPRPTCSADPNFSVVQTLTRSISIPKNATGESLAGLGVTSQYWPVISMVTTHVTQDACAGMAITLHFSVGGEENGE